MKKLLVLAVASMVASPAFAADLKWYGETGVRYSQNKFDDSLGTTASPAGGVSPADASKETTKTHDVRARLGVTGGKDHIDYGIGLHTGVAGGGVNTDYTTYGADHTDLGVAIELAYFRYSNDYGFGDLSVTAGRGNNVFAYDTFGQTLFDNDVTFNGFGWKWKWGSFGFNASQYLLGAKTAGAGMGASTFTKTDSSEAAAHKSFGTMLGFQPTFSWRFTDEIEAMFAVGYYVWNTGGVQTSSTACTGNYCNNLHGGSGSIGETGIATKPIGDSGQKLLVSNPKQWQFLVDTSLPSNLNFTGELVMNKKTYYDTFGSATTAISTAAGKSKEAKKTAYSAGLTWGHMAKARDWKVGYAYGSKGLASVVNYYSNDLFAADQKGHTLMADFMATDSLTIGAKALLLKEISKKDYNGNDVGNATTSANSTGRSHKTTYWQLTANVAF